jgi:hypothetical protein
MNQDNRVLSRKNARELTIEETRQVSGGLHTGSRCTIAADGKLDGPFADCPP